MDVRDRLRAAIAEKSTTPRAVSLAAGLSDSMVHKFLTGAVSSITIETCDKIACALGVDPAWLAYGEGTPEIAGELSQVWDRIAQEDKAMALRMLNGLARTGTDG